MCGISIQQKSDFINEIMTEQVTFIFMHINQSEKRYDSNENEESRNYEIMFPYVKHSVVITSLK